MRWLLNEKITRPSDFFRHPLLHVEASNSLVPVCCHGSAFTLLLENSEKLRSRWETHLYCRQATFFRISIEPAGGQGLLLIVNRCSLYALRLPMESPSCRLFTAAVMVPCACWARAVLNRSFLHGGDGDELLLRAGLSALAQMKASLEVVAVRETERRPVMGELDLLPFTVAPS